jgi:hypothetical protein
LLRPACTCVGLIWVSAAPWRGLYDNVVDHQSDRTGWSSPNSARSSGVAANGYRLDLEHDLPSDYLRSCAARCRDFAARQLNAQRAELFRNLAASFERDALAKERR